MVSVIVLVSTSVIVTETIMVCQKHVNDPSPFEHMQSLLTSVIVCVTVLYWVIVSVIVWVWVTVTGGSV